MVAIVELSSRITERGQTTVPKAIRQALGVDVGDRVTFRIDRNGAVTVAKGEQKRNGGGQGITAFLAFLDTDMSRHPAAIAPLDEAAHGRAAELTDTIEPLPLD